MRFYIVVGLALIISSCQVDYEDNSRLLFKGDVSNGLQNPFPDLPVEVYASTGEGVFNFTERVGVGKTTPDGSFEIIALSPKNPSYLQLLINDSSQEGHKPEFGSSALRRLDILGEKEATYIIPRITIDKRIDTFLEIKRTDNLSDTLSFRYRYEDADKILDFSQRSGPDDYENPNLRVGSGMLPSALDETTIELFDLTANDTLFLDFRLVNGNVSETTGVELIYKPESDNYVFEF